MNTVDEPDAMTSLPNQVYLVVGVLLLLGLILVWLGFRQLFRRRLVSGGSGLLAGALLIVAGVAVVGVVANIYTYKQLTAEQFVGTLSFERYAPQEYVARLVLRDGGEREFTVYGDECQLDARILKWKGYGNLIGLDTLYRLERLGGRYGDEDQETDSPRSVHSLAEQAGLDLWALINRFERWLPWADAVYGNAVYVPMIHDGRYRISMSRSGLVARADNNTAERAINQWQ